MACSSWEYSYVVFQVSVSEAISLGGPGFDSGWLGSDTYQTRTLISTIPFPCDSEPCEYIPVPPDVVPET